MDQLCEYITTGGNTPGNDGDDEPKARAEIIIAIFGCDDTCRQYKAEGHKRGEMLLFGSVHTYYKSPIKGWR